MRNGNLPTVSENEVGIIDIALQVNNFLDGNLCLLLVVNHKVAFFKTLLWLCVHSSMVVLRYKQNTDLWEYYLNVGFDKFSKTFSKTKYLKIKLLQNKPLIN